MKFSVLFILAIIFSASNAYADIGVPMIFVTFPLMLRGLIPIIIVEAYVLYKKSGLNFAVASKISAIMNVVSTIVGIPITWGILMFFQMITGGGQGYGLETPLQKILAVTWQSPWLIPYDSELYWMIPVAILVLLVPFFFATYFIELKIAERILKDADKAILKKGVFAANIASYIILFIIGFVLLGMSLKKGSL